MDKPKIIGVYFKRKGTEEYGGRVYNYFCTLPVSAGDIVSVPTAQGQSTALVCEVDVSEGSIDERTMPLLKTVTEYASGDAQEG